MNAARLKWYAYAIFVVLTFLITAGLLTYVMIKSDWHDFDVFYNSASAALNGKSIYIISGPYDLPFWYVPWAAWFYIPFAILPQGVALILFKSITILCAILVVNHLIRYYNPDAKFLNQLLILSLIIPMTLQLAIVGQMDYILLALIVVIMFAIDQKKDVLAGLLFPLLWIKPHLMIVFTLFAFWRAGKRTVLISIGFSMLMLIVETVISPGWYLDMLNLLKDGTQRTASIGFTTLPNLLGSQENWVGTANLPFTILLIIFAILLVWKFRALPTVPLLSLALAASLFCAPRAHAYDLTLLIPAVIWLTKEFKSTLWIWIAAAIIPPLTGYGSNAFLLTLLVFLLLIPKARKDLTTAPNNLALKPSS